MKITSRTEREISIKALKQAITAGRGNEVIKPFDELTFTTSKGETVTAVCAYVGDHFARFAFKDCLREMWRMNNTATNKGGYLNSEGRRHVIEDILPTLPEELREALAPRKMWEVIDGEKHEYADTLWLLSATDVFGADDWWNEETDSFQLPIFNSERDRVKEHPDEGTYFWWLRSPRASTSSSFVRVYAGGTVGYASAYHSLGFAPGFDL